LLIQLEAMREIIFGESPKKENEDILKFSIPISQMGNYSAVLQKREVLRDPTAEDNLQEQPLFGSPFKRKRRKSKLKNINFNVDEADVTEAELMKKKKPGVQQPASTPPTVHD